MIKLSTKWTKLSRKVLYHFTIFVIVNEILIIKIAESLIIFYSNIIKFTEKQQETKIIYFLLIEL